MNVRMTSVLSGAAAWRHAAVAVLLSAVMAAPASAQLGKLKKIAGDAVKDAAKDAAGVKPDPKASAGSTAARVDYAITDERASAILAVLAPLAADARREADARAANAAYSKKAQAFSDCVQKSATGATPDMAAMQSPKFEALTARMSRYADRVSALATSSQYRTYIAYADSSAVSQMEYAALLMTGVKCGTPVYKPAAILDAEAALMAAARSGVAPKASGDELTVPASQRAGMTTGQFGRIREAMAIWLLQKSGDLPADAYKFTEAEVAVLTAKEAQLAALAPLFKAGTMRWATWGDITSW